MRRQTLRLGFNILYIHIILLCLVNRLNRIKVPKSMGKKLYILNKVCDVEMCN